MGSPRPVAVFIGTRVEALRAVERYAEVRAVSTLPDSFVHRYCLASSRPCQLIDRARRNEAFSFLTTQKADLVLSAGYPFILPLAVLQYGPLFVNSHPALLPAYKGSNAIKDAYAKGEEYFGVTVHHMAEKVDEGAIIDQERLSVRGMTLQEIYDLIFGVAEPFAVSRALASILASGLL